MRSYKALVFDCDGVVLNSNSIKTEAFGQTVAAFGQQKADAMVQHHVANGGVSRYRKFEHFLRHIAPECAEHTTVEELTARYAHLVKTALLDCELTPGLERLREATAGTPWILVSGGDQNELRSVFAERDIARWFDGGIFGSPDSKDEIFKREIEAGRLPLPALYFGDNRYDHVASTAAGLEFAFVTGWTEFAGWQSYFADAGQPQYVLEYVQDILDRP